MAKKNLQSLLDKIITESAREESYRKISNTLIHIYEVDLDSLIIELKDQIEGVHVSDKEALRYSLTESQMAIVKKAATDYINAVKNDLKSNSNFDVVYLNSSPTSFVAEITSKRDKQGRDVFAYIQKSRRQSLNQLRQTLLDKLVESGIEQSSTLEYRTLGYYDKKYDKRVGGLLDLGHLSGHSISEQRAFNYIRDIDLKVSALKKKGITEEHPLFKLQAALHNNPSINSLKEIKLTYVPLFDQSKQRNRLQSDEERSLIEYVKKNVRNALESEDWFNFRGSPSAVDMVVGKIHTAAKKAGFTGTDSKLESASKDRTQYSVASKPAKGKRETERIKDTIKPSVVKGERSLPKATNWSSIVNIINSKLADSIIKFMEYPRLQNRTGTFANSVKIQSVQSTKEGYPSFTFDYQSNPYNVFDRYVGASPWNSPERDPRALITLAIRDIIKEMAINKFYVRRAV